MTTIRPDGIQFSFSKQVFPYFPPLNLVCPRGSPPPSLPLSLSLHRHSGCYGSFSCSSRTPPVKKEEKREGEKCHGWNNLFNLMFIYLICFFFSFFRPGRSAGSEMTARMTEESIKKALAATSEPGKCGEMILSLLRSAAAGQTQSVRLCEGG